MAARLMVTDIQALGNRGSARQSKILATDELRGPVEVYMAEADARTLSAQLAYIIGQWDLDDASE